MLFAFQVLSAKIETVIFPVVDYLTGIPGANITVHGLAKIEGYTASGTVQQINMGAKLNGIDIADFRFGKASGNFNYTVFVIVKPGDVITGASDVITYPFIINKS